MGYKDEETAAHASDTLARELIRNGEKGYKLNFPDDHTEVNPEQKNNYFGVSYNKLRATWDVCRYSKNEKKNLHNGTYKDEEIAAHASDTLARKLIENGEKGHKLNFPDDNTELYPKEVPKSSSFIGVTYHKPNDRWCAQRHSKNEKTIVRKGSYKDEETAAHASDTLARKLMAKGEKGHKLNFPDDDTEVYPEKKTNYFGVGYNQIHEKWIAQRYSKDEHETVFNGASYKDQETAAHASDTLARKLIANGEKGHKFNFPDDHTEVFPEKSSSS